MAELSGAPSFTMAAPTHAGPYKVVMPTHDLSSMAGALTWLILHFTQNGDAPTWLAVQSPTFMPAQFTEPRGLLPPQT